MQEHPTQILHLMDQARTAARVGDLSIALQYAKQAAKMAPRDPMPCLLQGDIALARESLREAAQHYREAIRRKPDLIAGHGNLGVVWLRQGDLRKAQQCFERVLRLHPNEATALLNLGNIAQAQGLLDTALDHYRQAIAADPTCAEALNNAGALHYAAGDLERSIPLLEQALHITPDYPEAHNNLGSALRAAGKLSAAITAYHKVTELTPHHAGSWNNLGNALVDRGDLEQGIAALHRAIQLQPNYRVAYSNWLMALNYVPQMTLDKLLQAHKEYDQRLGDTRAATFENRPEAADGRLRIGYVSPDFCQHPVAHLIEPILAETDRATVEIFCYADVAQPDAVTERLKAYGHTWRDIHGKSDEAVAAMIRQDRVNILVDLAGHTAFGRSAMFARRAAPVQVSWLGYFCTTGIAAMDYFLGDAICTPGEWQAYFVEKLAVLPHTRFCYRPPTYAPAVAPAPVSQGKAFTFGCFNNLAKINDGVIVLWSEILRAIPNSRMVLRARFLDDSPTRREIEARFHRAGAPLDRIEMYGHVPHPALLKAYDEIDLALDPFPFGGGMTTLESLWMGVPVLSLLGDRSAGRQSASFLYALNLAEFVAQSPADYVRLATEIHAHPENLSAIRHALRERMRFSPLCSERRFTRDLEALYSRMMNPVLSP